MQIEWPQLEELVRTWRLTDRLPANAIAPLIKAVDRHEQIRSEFYSIANGGNDATGELAARVARGELTAAESITAHVALSAAQEGVSAGNRYPRWRVLYESASAILRQEAEGFVKSADLHSIYVEAMAKLGEDQRRLFAEAGNPSTAEEALRRGGNAAAAWLKYEELQKTGGPLGLVGVALESCGLVAREEEVARAS